MKPLRIFISSREQELEPERETAETLIESLGMLPVRFERTSVPQPTAPHEAYLKEVESSDALVLMLWQKHSPAVVAEYNCAHRRGKPVLCLLKDLKSAYEESRSPELEGFIRLVNRDGHSSSHFRALRDLQEQLRRGINFALRPESTGQFHASSKEELFHVGTELLERASKRVILMAKTPIPLVGTRPYHGMSEPSSYEQAQQDAFTSLIHDASSEGGQKWFRCIASIPSMRADLLKEGPLFRERLKQRLGDFHERMRPSSRCELRWITGEHPSAMSYLVVDQQILVWFSDGSGESLWMKTRNERMAAALDRISAQATRLDLSEIHQRLEL